MKRRPIRIDVRGEGTRVDFDDGSTMWVDPSSRASVEAANREGCSFVWMDPARRRLSRTPAQVWRAFIARGAYIAVAAFETWRGRDRYYYMDVLGVAATVEQAEELGCPVEAGEAWLPDLRMVGSQLAVRMADPWGRPVIRRPEPGAERAPGYAHVWTGDDD
jgi:hypothetical protein